MAIIVQKYGGSSVRDLNKIKMVAQRIAKVRERGDQVVVVVSAMGDTTDDLLKMAQGITDCPDRRELDMLLSCGERITMSLLSMAVKSLGHDAISFTGSQSGIMTNDNHFNARIVEVRPFRIQDELERNRVVIVAGYQGTSYRREVTTLGRGGSDTTAVALAAALDAEYCEIYSDVDGVYSGDPNLISHTRHIGEISYDEMEELSRCGARVLNEQAVEFARSAGIAIYTRASSGGVRETIIRKDRKDFGDGALDGCSGPGPRVISITGRKGLVGLSIKGRDHNRICSILEKSADSIPFMSVSSVFSSVKVDGGGLELGVGVDASVGVGVGVGADSGNDGGGDGSGQVTEVWCTILLDPSIAPLPRLGELIGTALQASGFCAGAPSIPSAGGEEEAKFSFQVLNPLCTISAVGAMAGASSKIVASARKALAQGGVSILGMSLSHSSITFIINAQDYTEGQRLLHAALI